MTNTPGKGKQQPREITQLHKRRHKSLVLWTCPFPVGEQGWSSARGTYGTSVGHMEKVFLEEAESMAEWDKGTRLMDIHVYVCVTSVRF